MYRLFTTVQLKCLLKENKMTWNISTYNIPQLIYRQFTRGNFLCVKFFMFIIFYLGLYKNAKKAKQPY